MNTEPSHLSRTLLPFATMLLSVCIAPSARADRAENAFVTVRAVGAGVTRVDGRNFSANEDGEVEIEAQPGWTLLTPSRVRVTKGRSPHYQVRSSGGEQTGGGDIWRTVTERVRVHVQDPALTAALDAGGPYVYAAPSNGVWVAVSGSATGTPGLHVWEVRTTVYKNGEVVDTSAEIEPGDPFPLELDRWKWTWSPGAPGETNVQSFVSEPVLLPKGTYTASGTAEAWSSQCPDCHASKPASAPFVVSLLTISCNPWIGQDRTGDPTAPYESPKVTATASLDPQNPIVGKVTWGGVNKCEKRDPQDWTISLWTEDREKASDTYLGEKVTATACGATATTNFTIVKVDVTIGGAGESSEENPGAYVGVGYREPEEIPQWEFGSLKSVSFSIFPKDIPGNSPVSTVCGEQGGVYKTIGWNGWESLNRAKLPATVDEVNDCGDLSFHGIAPSESLQEGTLSISHEASGASDQSKFTTLSIKTIPMKTVPGINARTVFGVGEKVDLVLLPNGVQNTHWILNGLGSLSTFDGTTTKYTASPTRQNPIISARSADGETSVQLWVIPPEAVIMEKAIDTSLPDMFVVAFDANVFIAPECANFADLFVFEDSCVAEVSGCYANAGYTQDQLTHHPGEPLQILDDLVAESGWKCNDVDHVSSGGEGDSAGSWVWRIPWRYTLDGSSSFQFFVADHIESITTNNNGRLIKTLSKCGISLSLPEP